MSKDHISSLAPEAEWKVWYQDTFDRECPRQVEAAGHGLVKGLIELWARHLFETVRADGGRGFSRFNLWWEQEKQSIRIVGEWEGATRLRRWVFGEKQPADKEYVQERDEKLLSQVAAMHAALTLAGQTSEAILAAAQGAMNRQDFEARLFDLEKNARHEQE